MTDEVTRGMTPGRKIKAAMWLSVTVTASASLLAGMKAPDMIVSQVVWIIGLGWLGVILGQAGIDAFSKWTESKKP